MEFKNNHQISYDKNREIPFLNILTPIRTNSTVKKQPDLSQDDRLLELEQKFEPPFPQEDTGKIIGYSQLSISLEKLIYEKQGILHAGFLIALTIIAVGTIFSFAFAQMMVGPILAMTRTTTEIAKGNLKLRVNKYAKDEIGVLGECFNSMVDSLEKRDTEIQKLNKSLEQKVKERTKKLGILNMQLRQERDKTQSYLDIAGVMIVVLDVNYNIMLINNKGCEILGYEYNEIIGENWLDNFIFPQNRQQQKTIFDGLMAGEIKSFEYNEAVLLTKDGQERIILWHNSLLKDENKKVVAILASGEDITKRKHAEQELKNYRIRLEDLVKKRTVELININKQLLEEINERKKADDALQRKHHIQSALNSMLNISIKPYNLEEMLNKILKHIVSIPWLTLQSRGAIFLVDNTTGKLVMQSYCRLPENLQIMCAQIPFGKCLCGKAAISKKIQFANTLDECHENRKEGELPHGHYCIPIISSDKILGVLNLYVKEGHRRTKDEEEFFMAIGNVLAGIIKRKQAEEGLRKARDELELRVDERTAELKTIHEQLLHIEKLSALGKLAASVAHEFNNPVYGISMVLEELAENKYLDLRDKKSISLAIRECGRISRLINSLQDFYRPSSGLASYVNIHQLIDDILHFCGKKLKISKVKIIKEFTEDMPEIFVVTDQIKQVFLNIITNAEEAMPLVSGCLSIQTRVLKDKIQVIFKDNGRGISKKNMDKIFEPFFTTKGTVKGTGLGLSVSYGIIKGHKGDIFVESNSDAGTTFTIELPIKQSKPQVEQAVAPMYYSMGGGI